MRKSNSNIRMAFLSEAGAQLFNTDYFACVELDDYACYVVASGITDFGRTEAAKEAVENILISFQENPAMDKGALTRILRETNQRLLRLRAKERLKASVLMVVTDYETLRYAAAGNIRLRLYRDGRMLLASADASLARLEHDRGRAQTPIERHAERHNLYAYLGMAGSFAPLVSERVKLLDGDIAAIYTRGIWENIDAGELDEVFAGATDEPQPVLDAIEDLLLSRQPERLACYTLAVLFVNKTYQDPDRILRRKRRIRYALIAVLALFLLAVLIVVLNRMHAAKARQFDADFEEAKLYLELENFARAKESCDKALGEAKELTTRTGEAERLARYGALVDAILAADEVMKGKDYAAAYDAYTEAALASQEADGYGKDYIERQLARAEEHLSVTDMLEIGDKALAIADLARAEKLYFRALDKAALIHDKEGREGALAAIEKLYDEKAKQEKQAKEKLDKAGAEAVQDALAKGDQLMQAGDFEGAEKAFQQARQLANATGSREGRNDAMQALIENRAQKEAKEAEARQESEAEKLAADLAAGLEGKGDAAFEAGDYIGAQVYYLSAREKYAALPDHEHAGYAQQKADLAAQKAGEAAAAQDAADGAAQQARNFYAFGDWPQAMERAKAAKEAYAALGDKANTDAMQLLIDAIATDEQIAAGIQ